MTAGSTAWPPLHSASAMASSKSTRLSSDKRRAVKRSRKGNDRGWFQSKTLTSSSAESPHLADDTSPSQRHLHTHKSYNSSYLKRLWANLSGQSKLDSFQSTLVSSPTNSTTNPSAATTHATPTAPRISASPPQLHLTFPNPPKSIESEPIAGAKPSAPPSTPLQPPTSLPFNTTETQPLALPRRPSRMRVYSDNIDPHLLDPIYPSAAGFESSDPTLRRSNSFTRISKSAIKAQSLPRSFSPAGPSSYTVSFSPNASTTHSFSSFSATLGRPSIPDKAMTLPRNLRRLDPSLQHRLERSSLRLGTIHGPLSPQPQFLQHPFQELLFETYPSAEPLPKSLEIALLPPLSPKLESIKFDAYATSDRDEEADGLETTATSEERAIQEEVDETAHAVADGTSDLLKRKFQGSIMTRPFHSRFTEYTLEAFEETTGDLSSSEDEEGHPQALTHQWCGLKSPGSTTSLETAYVPHETTLDAQSKELLRAYWGYTAPPSFRITSKVGNTVLEDDLSIYSETSSRWSEDSGAEAPADPSVRFRSSSPSSTSPAPEGPAPAAPLAIVTSPVPVSTPAPKEKESSSKQISFVARLLESCKRLGARVRAVLRRSKTSTSPQSAKPPSPKQSTAPAEKELNSAETLMDAESAAPQSTLPLEEGEVEDEDGLLPRPRSVFADETLLESIAVELQSIKVQPATVAENSRIKVSVADDPDVAHIHSDGDAAAMKPLGTTLEDEVAIAAALSKITSRLERSLYRMSHGKLGDPYRSLREQVVISNFMLQILVVHRNLVDETGQLKKKKRKRKKSKKKKNKSKTSDDGEGEGEGGSRTSEDHLDSQRTGDEAAAAPAEEREVMNVNEAWRVIS